MKKNKPFDVNDKYAPLKLDYQICFSLYAASRSVIKLYKPFLDKYQLTYTQYLVLLVLWEDAPCTVKHLGDRLHLDSGTLSPLLKKLEALDYITKHRDPEDDRSVIVELTQSGQAMKDPILEVPQSLYQSLTMDTDQLIEMKNALDLLIDQIAEGGGEPR